MSPLIDRRHFIQCAPLVPLVALGCNKSHDVKYLAAGAALGGAILSVAFPPASAAFMLGGLLRVVSAGFTLYVLIQENSQQSQYIELPRPSVNPGAGVPKDQVRVFDQRTGRDMTSRFFIDPSSQAPNEIAPSNFMSTLRYRCLEKVMSQPYSYRDILTLQHRARMFDIPCDSMPIPCTTPTRRGNGMYTIRYGGVDWQSRSYADRAMAMKWYQAFYRAPGFDIGMV
jgi:hypothetical protein